MGSRLYVLALCPFLIPCVGYFLHVVFFAGTFCDSKASLVGRTVIVTGANTGIGKTTAMDMASRGARVIMACRSEKRTLPAVEEIKSKSKNSQVIFMSLDLASFQSVRDFAVSFKERESRLDILINNAGLVSSDEPRYNGDGVEMTMAVNHLGHFLLTDLLLDVMKKTGPGSRIVNVASAMYNYANPAAFKDFDLLRTDGTADVHETFDLNQIDKNVASNVLAIIPEGIQRYVNRLGMKPRRIRYSNSKLANLLFTKELARRLEGTGITTYAVHPGVIKTEIGVDRGQQQKDDELTLAKLLGIFNPFPHMLKTLEGGAQTTICCAVSEKFANDSGLYYSDCTPVDVLRQEMVEPTVATDFWLWSANLVSKSK